MAKFFHNLTVINSIVNFFEKFYSGAYTTSIYQIFTSRINSSENHIFNQKVYQGENYENCRDINSCSRHTFG